MSVIPCPLSQNALQKPESTALIWGRRRFSWELLNSYVLCTSRHLKEISVLPGSRVLVMAESTVQTVILLLSLWRAGVTAVPINPALPLSDIKDIAEQLNSHFIFVPASLENPPKVIGLKPIVIDQMINYQFAGSFFAGQKAHESEIDTNFEALIVPTSGSSGKYKLARLTYNNFLKNAEGAHTLISFTAGDSWLLSLPLWHVSGLSIIFRSLYQGGAIVMAGDFPAHEALQKFRPTHVSVVPTQLRRLLASDVSIEALSALKAILVGGAPVPENLKIESAQRNLPVFVTYGMTETASQIATGKVEPGTGRPRPVPTIKTLPCCELKLSKDNEILVRGETLFKGYLGGPTNIFDEDGWFSTGDIGTFCDGGINVIGRKDSMFISGGENVYPEKIERVLGEYPGVEAAVVVPIDDADFGQVGAAFIKSSNGALTFPNLDEKLSKFEKPKCFYPWPEDVPVSDKVNRWIFKKTI